MSLLGVYFRKHRWQKRIVLALLVLIAGLLTGIALQPLYVEYRLEKADRELLARLDSPDALTRQRTIEQLLYRAKKFPATHDRVREALETGDDRRFWAVYSILRRCPSFRLTDLPPETFDRIRLIELRDVFSPPATTTLPTTGPATATDPTTGPASRRADGPASAATRRQIVLDLLLGGRDNRYVREAAPLAADDPYPPVRVAASPLAARLGEDGLLEDLLADPDPRVVASAALSGGAGERHELAEAIEALLFRAVPELQQAFEDDGRAGALRDVIASCAVALAGLDAGRFSPMLCGLIRQTDDEGLAERLLLIVPMLDRQQAGGAVMARLHRARFAGRRPTGMELWAAGALQLRQAGPFAMDVLRAAARREAGLLESQVLGALGLVSALRLPIRTELAELVETLWYPGRPALLVRLARLLGAQAGSDEYQPDGAPTREECRELLVRATQYATVWETDEGEVTLTTPMGSAAAAVALWLLEPTTTEFDLPAGTTQPDEPILELSVEPNSAFYLREALLDEGAAAGDYVAWRIGLSGRSESAELDAMLLPPRGSERREYNPSVRATGALILALSASGEAQRRTVRERLAMSRPGEAFVARAGRQCGLLIAGDRSVLPAVRELLDYPEYPAPRALLALLAAGDRQTLDWLLWDTHWRVQSTPAELADLLVAEGFDDVFWRVAPQLPRPPAEAGQAAQRWVVRWMQCVWGVRRNDLAVGLGR